MSSETTEVFNKNAFDSAVRSAKIERTKIFYILYPNANSEYDHSNYPNFFEFKRLTGHKDYTFSKKLLDQLNNNKISNTTKYKSADMRTDRYVFNFIDLLYKSYLNAGTRPVHIHDLTLITQNTLDESTLTSGVTTISCDICDPYKISNTSKIPNYKYLHTYYHCDICKYDECLRCHRRSDREKHEHDLSIVHSTGRGESDKYSCNTCGRFTKSGECWICEECKKEGKTYVECYVCHSEPTKDQTVFPNILDGTNVIVTNKNKITTLVVRPAPSPATLTGGKRHHTKRKRHQSRNHTKRNHN